MFHLTLAKDDDATHFSGIFYVLHIPLNQACLFHSNYEAVKLVADLKAASAAS